jgi:perosamine synthetase
MLPQIELPSRSLSWFVYVVRLADHYHFGVRDRVMASLNAQGIGCARYFAPIHLQPAYERVPSARQAILPVTELVAHRTLALPFFNRISPREINHVASTLAIALAEHDELLDNDSSLAEA